MRPDRANFAADWDDDQMLTLLLRQLKRPLATSGIELTESDIERIAADGGKHGGKRIAGDSVWGLDITQRVRVGLVAVITESERVLASWDLTFQQALSTSMDDIPGWETTAEFLEIANEKANAELRISTGAVLLTALGDWRYIGYLWHLVERDDGDVDAVLAQRILLLISGIDGTAGGWRDQLRAWVESQAAT